MIASANVDLVRSIVADWERGDFSSIEWAHPEIDFSSPHGLEGTDWRGMGGMVKAWRETMTAWDDLRVQAEGYRELDRERVLVLHSFSGRGKSSGLDVGPTWSTGALLFHVRSGKATRLVSCFDRERALTDLGLSPEL